MPGLPPDEFKKYYQKVLHSLHALVQKANASTGSKIPVTISVKGIIISGQLVSLKEFHDGVTDIMWDAMEDSENKEESIRDMRDIVQKMKGVYENEDFWDLVNSYICIRDPYFVLGGGGWLESPNQFWVGKIESGDGFMVGSIKQTGSHEETPGTE
jgi:hypothetical protein